MLIVMKIKSITRIVLPKYIIIVQQTQSLEWDYEQRGITELEVLAYSIQDASMREVAERLLSVSGVCSVEIVGWDNNGIRMENE